jgi:hypothetical protein
MHTDALKLQQRQPSPLIATLFPAWDGCNQSGKLTASNVTTIISPLTRSSSFLFKAFYRDLFAFRLVCLTPHQLLAEINAPNYRPQRTF